MSKIIKYEIKLLLLKPYVLALLAAGLIYSYYMFSTETILGVSDTAPFSGWSFGKYMGSSALWALIVSLCILVSSRSGKNNRTMAVLTDVSGYPLKKLSMMRSLIVAGFFLVHCMLAFIMGCVFLYCIFGVISIGNYIPAFLLITVPCVFIIVGIGNLVGNVHPVFMYAFIILIIVMSFLSFSMNGGRGELMCYLDTAGASYFEKVSAMLETFEASETPFVIRGGYILSRMLYVVIGVAAFILGGIRIGKKQKYS